MHNKSLNIIIKAKMFYFSGHIEIRHLYQLIIINIPSNFILYIFSLIFLNIYFTLSNISRNIWTLLLKSLKHRSLLPTNTQSRPMQKKIRSIISVFFLQNMIFNGKVYVGFLL